MWAEGTDVGAWTGIIGTVVNMGFSALVAWYLLSKAIPKMQEDYRASEKESQTNSLKAQKESQAEYLASLEKRSADFKEDERERKIEAKEALEIVIRHCEREGSRRDQMIQVQSDLHTAALHDNREVMEEVRDALRGFKCEGPRDA